MVCSVCGGRASKANPCPNCPLARVVKRKRVRVNPHRGEEEEEAAANDALKADTARLNGIVQQAMKLQFAVEKLGGALYQPTAAGAIQEFLHETGIGVTGVDRVFQEGTSALVMVCTQGKLTEAKGLVEVGSADVNLEALELCTRVPDKHVGKASSAWKQKRTPLMAASSEGHVAIVGYLISKGADPNKATTDTGRTPLILAVHGGHVEIATLLLGKGADPNKAMTGKGHTPLILAVHGGHVEIATLLLGKGADPNKASTGKGHTPLILAAQEGRLEIATLLLGKGADPNKARTSDDATPLILAVQEGRLEIATLLLDKGADPNKAATDTGDTPLIFAVFAVHECRVEIVTLLLGKGADPNKATTDTGATSLYVAVQEGHLEIATLLLGKGADPNKARTSDGDTPLYVAVHGDHVEIATLLLGKGADPNKARTSDGRTPLILAVHTGHVEIATLLLGKDADPNKARTSNGPGDGDTPLTLAAHAGRLEIATLLLGKGADPNYLARTSNGRTPLIHAVHGGHVEIATLLLGKGADPNKATIIDGDTPLIFAVRRGHVEIATLLLDKDANPNKARTRDGTTPLIRAVHGGHVEIATLLLGKGADPKKATTDTSDTPLYVAVQNGHIEIATLLLGKGADPNKARTSDGRTPLILAVHAGHVEIATLLLGKDADPNKARADTGATPLILAAQNGHVGLAIELIHKGANPDHAQKNGSTALYAAAGKGNLAIVSALLSHVRHPNQSVNGKTALYVALECQHSDTVQVMLQMDAIHLAPAGGVAKPEVVQILRGATQAVLEAFATTKSAVFGGNLRGQQLWLWCNLMVAVGPNPTANALQLNVQRGNMLDGLCAQFGIDETTGQVSAAARAQQLNVQFVGENGGGDGLRREWFNRATAEIVDLGKGLFSSKDLGRTVQPNAESMLAAGPDHLSYFALLGRIAGFALYHRETIPAQWTTAFIKAAFGFPIVSKDLESVDPDFYKNNIQLIETYAAPDHDGMPLAAYWSEVLTLGVLTFAVDPPKEAYSDGNPSEKRRKLDQVELKPGGAKIPVTDENKAEYLQLFVQHRLIGAIKDQVQAFQTGLGVFFSAALLARVRRECSPLDVKLLLCGAPAIDVDDWQASATYRGGLAPDSQEVVWFWSLIRGMDANERAKVLDFCTGSPQAPATGFANLMGYSGNQQKFCLELLAGGPDRLPTAATCFNLLKMPRYTSEEQLRDRLLMAANNAQGFDEGAVAV